MGLKDVKKRGPSPFASPERLVAEANESRINKSSAVTLGTTDKAVRIKKKYKFAPVNTLSDGKDTKKRDPEVLRSISVSEVRKSKKSEASAPSLETAETKIKKNTPKGPGSGSKINAEIGRSEEVVWQFSPNHNERLEYTETDRGYRSPSEDSLIEQVVKESSTPIVPNKFRSVLNLSHINTGSSRNVGSPLLASKTQSLRQNSLPRSLSGPPDSRPSTRDIDEIINDIEGDFELRPPFQSKDIPSSPTRMVSQKLQANEKCNEHVFPVPTSSSSESLSGGDDKKAGSCKNDKSNSDAIKYNKNEADVNSDSDDDDDDSLIEVLTQRFGDAESASKPATVPTANEKVSELHLDSDDTYDDSLIEYLQTAEQSTKVSVAMDPDGVQIESQIDSVEKQFSQNLTVQERAKFEPDAIEHYIKRARFAVLREDMNRVVLVEAKEQQIKNNVSQKVLKCIDHEGKFVNLIIREPWVNLKFEMGDVIHTIRGQNCSNGRLFSNDTDPQSGKMNDNLLILNPDILLSATTIGRAIECQRKAIICGQINGPGEPSLPALVGTIVHELLQACLKYKLDHRRLSDGFMTSTLKSLLNFYAADIILCQTTKELLLEQISTDHSSNIKHFIDEYVKGENCGYAPKKRGPGGSEYVSIANVIDIEENIWSPMYGLKGFIDATVEARLNDNSRFISPLELKTGKTKSISHEAQGTIYTLLLNDRYEIPVHFFLLFYTKSNDFTKHNTLLSSLKHLLVLRNQVSVYLKHELTEITTLERKGAKLPPILRSSTCDHCYSKSECMVLNSLCDDGTAAESGLKPGEYEALAGHLINNHTQYKEFFMKYEDLIVKEESSLNGINREIFLLDSRTRESLSGKCLSNLQIKESDEDDVTKLIKYTFIRDSDKYELPLMTNSQLSKNDIVYVSDESGHFALCSGRVHSISSNEVSLTTSRRLESNNIHVPGFEKNSNQTLRTVLMPAVRSSLTRQKPLTYRIDRNEIQHGMAMARFNLLNLFLPPVPDGAVAIDDITGGDVKMKESWGGDSKSRELIIDGRCPRFVPESKPPLIAYDINAKANFNVDQQKAFDKVMRAEDYALILGMPGTGKTTLIVEIVKTLLAGGKTIMLTSYTHSAIDNILIKLKNCGINIMRLGNKHRVHPEAQEFVVDISGAKSFQDVTDISQRASVVATTCLNINDTLLSIRRKDFDYVLIDEASQLSLPMCVGPLKFASKFVLVGDHYQLPPLVKNDAARLGGLDESLFKLLCDKHPESVVELTYQYRMCQEVMTLSNYLIYDGKLKCVSDQVRDQTLNTPYADELIKLMMPKASKPWLQEVVKSDRKVVFLDHDKCDSCQEVAEKDNIKNQGEAEVVWQCVAAMIRSGVPRTDIGVMTLYRAQLRLLRKMFDSEEDANLEILTADQFQGRDKKCIVISMVRSNNELNGGSLLRELRRVNVAMTRAKCKLIIVGSKTTVSSVENLRGFMELLETRGWLYTLPPDCLECYKLPRESASQRSAQKTVRKAANVTGESKFAQNKPIVRDILNGM